MAGTKAGGRKAALTNRAKYGDDFYARIGRKGGHNGHTGGFASDPELAKRAGAIGGRKSKRGKSKSTESASARKAHEIEEFNKSMVHW